jgi:RNA polymerase sigma-70 factor, ECF subfamily
MSESVPDVELMRRLADDDDRALNELMERWTPRLITFLLRMTARHVVALDLAQETFVKLYQQRKRYRPKGNFSTYLFTIAANLARNQQRWQNRHPTVEWQELPPDQAEPSDERANPAEQEMQRELASAIQQAFQRLPTDLREAMTLFIDEDLSYAEIAQISGCSCKAVETRIYRARQLLKADLESLRWPAELILKKS